MNIAQNIKLYISDEKNLLIIMNSVNINRIYFKLDTNTKPLGHRNCMCIHWHSGSMIVPDISELCTYHGLATVVIYLYGNVSLNFDTISLLFVAS